MNTISFLRVSTQNLCWAAAFVDAYEKCFRGALMDRWEKLEPTLAVFAEVGGELCLSSLEYECSGSYLEEYSRAFLEASAQEPGADFTGTAFSFSDSSDITEYLSFRPAGKKLRIEQTTVPRPVIGACPICGAELPEPMNLYDRIRSGRKIRCPACRRKLDPKKLGGTRICRTRC